eukprot:CCRYP_020886-RA/>CCRYP_020886-RA protein AED:0.24 eAED:0.31 QI:0/0/0/1/0/0/2/43/575
MIVLGRHVLAHSYEPTERGDGDNTSSTDATERIDTHTSREEVVHIEVPPEQTITILSVMLGSIGATPIASCPPVYFTWPLGTNPERKEENVSSYLHATSQLVESHVLLIQAMTDALDVLKTGTSLRLGLGPPTMSYSGNDGLVSRAEKTWLDHRPLQIETCSEDRNPHRSRSRNPRMTLWKSRRILHQVTVDQATSLRCILTAFLGDRTPELGDWDDFMDDMQFFSQGLPTQTAPVLTLSKLSFWMNGLRDLLSFTISHLLSDGLGMDNTNGLLPLLKQSCQFAKERVYYLSSAFGDLCRSSRGKSIVSQIFRSSSESNPNDVESNKRHALKLIHQLQCTLDAAQVSLWAFRQSFTEEDQKKEEGKRVSDSEDPEIWWSQLKDLLSQTSISMGHFEHSFLATRASDNEEEAPDSVGEPSYTINATKSNHGTEFFVDSVDTPKGEPISKANDTVATEENAHKTLIFSGSGLHKKSRQSFGKSGSGRNSAVASTSCEVFDQTMLMCDLRKRLKTMQLAEEHEVVSLDACKEDSRRAKSMHRQAAPFFLGVQGSLLTELASALACDKGQGNTLGDSIP